MVAYLGYTLWMKTLCCFMANQLWLMKRIREEEEERTIRPHKMPNIPSIQGTHIVPRETTDSSSIRYMHLINSNL